VVILFNLLKMGEIYKSKLNTYIHTCRRSSSSNSRSISVSSSVSSSRCTGSSSSSGDSSGGRGSISCGRWWW